MCFFYIHWPGKILQKIKKQIKTIKQPLKRYYSYTINNRAEKKMFAVEFWTIITKKKKIITYILAVPYTTFSSLLLITSSITVYIFTHFYLNIKLTLVVLRTLQNNIFIYKTHRVVRVFFHLSLLVCVGGGSDGLHACTCTQNQQFKHQFGDVYVFWNSMKLSQIETNFLIGFSYFNLLKRKLYATIKT